jgi:hypothetical protein
LKDQNNLEEASKNKNNKIEKVVLDETPIKLNPPKINLLN